MSSHGNIHDWFALRIDILLHEGKCKRVKILKKNKILGKIINKLGLHSVNKNFWGNVEERKGREEENEKRLFVNSNLFFIITHLYKD